MGILDVFSDGNERDAADVVQRGYRKGYQGAKKDLGRGFRGLKRDYAGALNQINAGARTATGAVTAGRDAALGNVGTAATTARGDIVAGQRASLNNIHAGMNASLGYYQPYADAGARGSAMYTNALGLNGASGNRAAVNAFQVGPGYQFAMNEGLQAIDRRAASRGMLASGNTSIDTIDYAQGRANQEYGTWLDRLYGQQQMGVGVAGAQAGIRTAGATQLAGINTGASRDIANISTGLGAAQAGINTGAATQQAGIATNAGTQNAAIKTGLGDVKMNYGEKLADLGYATRLGMAGVEGSYLAGKDQSGMNIVGAATGGASTGARLLGAA